MILRAMLTATALAVGAGCGDQAAPSGAPAQVRAALDLGNGVHLDSVDTLLTGPGGLRRTGTLAVGSSFTLTAALNVPVPGSYLVRVRGTASDDLTVCTGSQMLSVTQAGPAVVMINLACMTPRVGAIGVQGDANLCPLIEGGSVLPTSVAVGRAIAIQLFASDLDHQPSALSASWSATAGTLTNTSAAGATLACTAVGPATVSVVVSDGDATPGCPATWSVDVQCTAVAP